ncbi:MAG: hypothetical protein ACKVP7_04570 [Hyphomicrobiaceae bacterium]
MAILARRERDPLAGTLYHAKHLAAFGHAVRLIGTIGFRVAALAVALGRIAGSGITRHGLHAIRHVHGSTCASID